MATDKMDNQELISALADGQLQGDELARGVQAAAGSAEGRSTWHAYQVVGEVLRTGQLARGAAPEVFLARLQERLRAEQPAAAAATATQGPQEWRRPAANDGFWKMVAGFASVAAVTAVGWNLWSASAPAVQPQLAAAPSAITPASVDVRAATMIRDPRLDQLLMAHRQFGGGAALHAPGGFLRNAAFEGPAR